MQVTSGAKVMEMALDLVNGFGQRVVLADGL